MTDPTRCPDRVDCSHGCGREGVCVRVVNGAPRPGSRPDNRWTRRDIWTRGRPEILGFVRMFRNRERQGWRSYWARRDDAVHDTIGVEHAHGAPWPSRGEGSFYNAFGIKVSTTGEETLDVHLAVPGLRLYLNWTRSVDGRHVQLRPRVRFQGEIHPTGVSWCIGQNPHSWESRASWQTRLRRNDLTWWRTTRREVASVAYTVPVAIVMPEGAYAATARLEQSRWRKYLGPYRLTRRSRRRLRIPLWLQRPRWRVSIDVPAGLPVPGKGENSWDCGPDATYGVTYPELRHEPGPDWAVAYAEVLAADTVAERRRRHAPDDYAERDTRPTDPDPGKAATP